jgi:hypothetical protein
VVRVNHAHRPTQVARRSTSENALLASGLLVTGTLLGVGGTKLTERIMERSGKGCCSGGKNECNTATCQCPPGKCPCPEHSLCKPDVSGALSLISHHSLTNFVTGSTQGRRSPTNDTSRSAISGINSPFVIYKKFSTYTHVQHIMKTSQYIYDTQVLTTASLLNI